MKKTIVPTLLILTGALSAASAQGIWNGSGTDARWSTPENWAGIAVPVAGADVTFGSAFGSGSTVLLNGNREVGLLTFDFTGAASRSLSGTTLTAITINSGITRSSSVSADTILLSNINLPGNIEVNLNSTAGRLIFSNPISGAGAMEVKSTAATAVSLLLNADNSSWSGGLTLGAAPANSAININHVNGLGSGDITWLAGANSSILNFAVSGTVTVANAIKVTGDRTINPDNNANSVGTRTIFNGSISGTTGAAIRFTPRVADITGHVTELNGVNVNADAASRMVFYGSTHNTTFARGNTYLIGNNQALNWGRVILGQTSVTGDEVALLYKNGITIAKELELNDSDNGLVTLGVSGTGASAVQSGTVRLVSFDGGARTKQLAVVADADSTYKVSGQIQTASVLDTLNLEKTGDGVVSLDHAAGNQYTGTTLVSAGTLLVNNASGSGTGTGAVTVSSVATFGGVARLAPTAGNLVTINGVLAPGVEAGTVTLDLAGASKLNFGAGSALAFDLGTSSDLVAFAAAGNWLSGSGNAALELNLGDGFQYSQTYSIFSGVTTPGFTFDSISGYDDSQYVAQVSHNVLQNRYEIAFAPVPEPGVVSFLAAGGVLLCGGFLARRRGKGVLVKGA